MSFHMFEGGNFYLGLIAVLLTALCEEVYQLRKVIAGIRDELAERRDEPEGGDEDL